MNMLKSLGLLVLLAIGLSSCIVAAPGYGGRRGPGWHPGPPGHHHGPKFGRGNGYHRGGGRGYDRGYSRGGRGYRR